MAATFNQISLGSFSIHKLLRKSSIAKLVLILKIVFVGVAFLFLVALISTAIESFLAVRASKSTLASKLGGILEGTATPTDASPTSRNYDVIAKRNIFGEVGVKPTPKPQKKEDPVKSQLPLGLIGTFIESGSSSQAIIENQKQKEQDVFLIGDSIFGEAKLVAIYTHKVEIDRNGTIEVLTIDDGAEASGEDGGAPEDTFVVEEEELNTALNNLPLLLTQARAVPYFKDGKSVGLRLFAIKSGSLYEKVGLRNGDILKTINDSSLADITQAMKLFERLKEERSINLTLERNKETKVFRYKIQ